MIGIWVLIATLASAVLILAIAVLILVSNRREMAYEKAQGFDEGRKFGVSVYKEVRDAGEIDSGLAGRPDDK